MGNPIYETPPESPIPEEETMTIEFEPAVMHLPPRPPSAAAAAAASVAAAAAASATMAAVSRRNTPIPSVDSCGNLLDPGLVAFAELPAPASCPFDVFALASRRSARREQPLLLSGGMIRVGSGW